MTFQTTREIVRNAGGIVHSDGNIFFTGRDQFLKAVEVMSAQQRQFARDAGAERAWRDVFRRFTPAQRRHIANLLAHDWTITAVEMQTRYGCEPRRTEGEIPLDAAIKALDEEKAKARAERLAGSTTGGVTLDGGTKG